MKELNKYLDSITLATNLIKVSRDALHAGSANIAQIDPVKESLLHAIHILDEVVELCNESSFLDSEISTINRAVIYQNEKDIPR
jgi:hypothetical protein